MMFRKPLIAIVVAIGALNSASADELPSPTIEALERFYHHFGGPNWINNAGWLSADVNPCEWYGVGCVNQNGESGVVSLELASNNLVGELDQSDIFEHVISRIDLSDNRITGTLAELPWWLNRLNLSDNLLIGTLPELPPDAEPRLQELSLARNEFAGEVPESWTGLWMHRLDLSDNALEGALRPALFAARSQVDLAGNRYRGIIPADTPVSHLARHTESSRAGGLNLCWNDLEIVDEQLEKSIGERHIGGEDFHACWNRERQKLTTDVSGSWYEPERDGEGVVLQLLPDDRALLYHFGFDGAGRQHWLMSLSHGIEQHYSLHWWLMVSTRGQFGEGMPEGYLSPPSFEFLRLTSRGTGHNWRMDRISDDTLHIERLYQDCANCPDIITHPIILPVESDRYDYQRLTRLAGTRCDHQQPNQALSGAWYDPERDGEGFVIEVLEDGRGLVYWFAYQPDDSMNQAWMMGDGDFEGQTLKIESLVQPTGGVWGEDFESEAIVKEVWGSLSIEFFDDDQAHLHFESIHDEFGSGDYPLQRLSRVRLTTCEE